MSALALVSLLLTATPADDARAALAPFKKTLKETLLKALEKSPEAAVEVCSVRAPELARAASTPTVTVGRSAFKLRNPKNAPPPWLPPLMEQLAKEKSGAEVSRTVTLPDGRVGYAEPIWMGAPCLVCHGKALAPTLDAKLKAAYPQDAARGFELGELRGVFWAEVKPVPP
jgi:hypothetical protein